MELHKLIHFLPSGCTLNGVGSSPKLLDWDTVQRKLPWNVVVLLGAGFVLAEASRVRIT